MSQPFRPAGPPPGQPQGGQYFQPTPGQFGPGQFGPGQIAPGQGNPYGPPPSSGGSKTLLIVFGVLGVGVLLCCGVCGGVGFVTIQNEHKEHAQTLQNDYRDHPIVVEQLGGLDSVTGNLAKGLNDEDSDMVFDARGPKGAGTLHIEALFGEIYSVILKKDGQEWDLTEDEESTDEMPAGEAMPADQALPADEAMDSP
jgi:hypothetical protein